MAQRRADVVQKRAGRGYEVALPLESEAVQRKHLEVARKDVRRSVEREGPAVLLRLGKRLRRTVPLHRLVELLLRGERLDGELSGREVEERKAEPVRRGDVVVDGLVEESVLRDCAWRDDAGDLAADESLRRLRILHLVAERGGLAGADELREVAVEGVVRHSAHRLAAAVGERRAEYRGRHDRVLPEHLVEIPEAEHQYRPGRYLALKREVLPLHWCQLFGHRSSNLRVVVHCVAVMRGVGTPTSKGKPRERQVLRPRGGTPRSARPSGRTRPRRASSSRAGRSPRAPSRASPGR